MCLSYLAWASSREVRSSASLASYSTLRSSLAAAESAAHLAFARAALTASCWRSTSTKLGVLPSTGLFLAAAAFPALFFALSASECASNAASAVAREAGRSRRVRIALSSAGLRMASSESLASASSSSSPLSSRPLAAASASGMGAVAAADAAVVAAAAAASAAAIATRSCAVVAVS